MIDNTFKSILQDNKKLLLVILFYISYLALPIFNYYVKIPVQLAYAGEFVLLVLCSKYKPNRKSFSWLLLYLSVLFMYTIAGHSFYINGLGEGNSMWLNLTIEAAWLLPNAYLCCILQDTDDNNVYKILSVATIIILVCSFLTVLPYIQNDSRFLRINETNTAGEGLVVPGRPSYTLMSCYVLYFPVLCYGFIIFSGKLRMAFGAIIILSAYMIIKTEITTAFLMMVLVLIFTLMHNNSSESSNLIKFAVVGVIIIVLFESGVVLKGVEVMQGVYEGTAAESKFKDFHNMLEGGGVGGNQEVRNNARKISMNVFFSNPIIGDAGDGSKLGQHSILVDRLGSMGLLGAIPFYMFLITSVLSWIEIMPDRSSKYFYIAGCIITIVFLFNKGLFSGEGFLFFLVLLPVSIIGLYEWKTELIKL